MFRWTVWLKGGSESPPHHVAVTVADKIYYFGRFSDVGQIHVKVFSTVALRWLRLPPVPTGRAECPLVAGLHCEYTAVLIDDLIYIWGGQHSSGGDNKRILYAFDVDTHRCLKPEASGTIPEPRCCHSACVFGKLMYVQGGWTEERGTNNDMYKLDSTTMVWSLINTRGTLPLASLRDSATVIGTKMFVFGGRLGDSDNKMRVFDTETNCWLSTTYSEEQRGHSAFAYNGELYIFAGQNLKETVDNLWTFNPVTLSWKKVGLKGEGPLRLDWSTACCCLVGDQIVLVGRSTTNGLYMLDLRPSLKTLCKLAVIQSGLEQSGLPHNIRWELATMTSKSN